MATTYDKIWTGLLTAGAVVEVVALSQRNPIRKSGTFSTYCRTLCGTQPDQPHWRRYPLGLTLAALEVWWFGHLLFRWGPNLDWWSHRVTTNKIHLAGYLQVAPVPAGNKSLSEKVIGA